MTWIQRSHGFSINKLLAGVLAGGLAVWMAGPAGAQQSGASITGTVTDTSGAAIPGAKVTVTNVAQNTNFTSTTNAAGVYNLPSIPTGTYIIQGSAKGFQTTKQGPFSLVLNQSARVNLKLAVGQQTQTVQVTGQAPLLQTETTETSTNLNAAANVALPLLQRNYSQLTMLTPGVTTPSPTSSAGMGGADLYINGNRAQNNNFLLGGVDNNQTTENQQGYSPSPDAISQFTVVSSNASAQYGNFMGGIISAEIKSGTNRWHGNLYEFVQNDKLNANQWANNWNGGSRAKVRYNNFGGTVGGPIFKNKLFVFGDYEGTRNDTPNSTAPITVFTAAERAGNFGDICTGTGGSFDSSGICMKNGAVYDGAQLYLPSATDPTAPRPAVPFNDFANVPGGVAAVEGAVPAALFANPALYPAPMNGNLLNNYLNTNREAINTNQGDIRVDYNINSTNHIFWRGSMLRQSNLTTNTFPLLLPTSQPAHDWNSVLDWTHTIGASFVNDAKIGINYVGGNGIVEETQNLATMLGIADGNNRGPGLPLVNFIQSSGATFSANAGGGSGLTNLGNADTFGLRGATVLTYEDQMVITVGKQVIHTGAQLMRYRDDYFYGGNNGLFGDFQFNGQFTGNNAAVNSSGQLAPTVGYDGADFFLGLPSLVGQGPGTGVFGQRKNVFGVYAQDDWHATNTVTLNLGLRYQNFRPLYEIYDRELNVVPVAGTVVTAGTALAEQAYGSGGKRSLYRPYNGRGNWQPRVGLTWQPMSRTVFRAGYGISSFMEGTGLNLRPTTNPPFGAEHQNDYSSLDYPGSTLAQGFANFQNATGINQFNNVNLRLWSPDVMPAVVEQWNVNVQQQLSNSTTFQIGYIGEHGTHEVTALQLLDGVLPQDCVNNHGSIEGVACSTSAISPSPYLSGNSALASTISNISATYTNGMHRYNAMQLVLQHRMASGLQYQGSYTWSKCMSNSGGFYGDGGQTSAGGEVYPQDIYNLFGEFGPCFNDTTNLISAYAIYTLPFGTANHNIGTWGNALLGHWQVSGTWNWHTGFAMSPTGPNNTGNGDFACCRLNCNGPVMYSKSSAPLGGLTWFAPSSFSAGGTGVMPTCGRGVLRGPGISVFNFSLMRNLSVGESRYFQVRADFNNVFNHPILNAPNTGLGNTLGLVQASQGARVVQLAVKFYF